ncbi:MAG: BrnA antitoxin family protein [Acidobacteriota bacterium]|nr:BrnA antitoxin family protein [Acidobacteriota bacterium]
MSKNKNTQPTSISQAQTLEEIGEFWDAHSLDDYWDKTCEAQFEVRAKQRKRITLEPQIYKQLEAEARIRGVVPETLVNLWLAEKLQTSK